MKRKIRLPLTAIAVCGLSFIYLCKLVEQKKSKNKGRGNGGAPIMG
jgi:hypothetical protein